MRQERWGGIIFLLVFIGTHLIFDAKVAVKVIGVASIAIGAVWLVKKSVPVGIEGCSPPFYVNGLVTQLQGAVVIGLGIALMLFPSVAASILG